MLLATRGLLLVDAALRLQLDDIHRHRSDSTGVAQKYWVIFPPATRKNLDQKSAPFLSSWRKKFEKRNPDSLGGRGEKITVDFWASPVEQDKNNSLPHRLSTVFLRPAQRLRQELLLMRFLPLHI